MSRWLVIAAAFGFVGVVAGALGAHAAARWLDAEGLPLWDTAVRYQMFHVAPMLAVGWLASRPDASSAVMAAGCTFTAGVVAFCGALYVSALTGMDWVGAVTPVGGVLLLAGWLALGLHGLALARRSRRRD